MNINVTLYTVFHSNIAALQIIAPPIFSTQKYIFMYSKSIFFLPKTTKFHQWDIHGS